MHPKNSTFGISKHFDWIADYRNAPKAKKFLKRQTRRFVRNASRMVIERELRDLEQGLIEQAEQEAFERNLDEELAFNSEMDRLNQDWIDEEENRLAAEAEYDHSDAYWYGDDYLNK